MDNIKTVREFLIDYNKLGKLDFEGDEYSKTLNDEQVLDSMIEFAKMHVQQALKAAHRLSLISFIPYDEEEWSQNTITREDIIEFYSDGANEDFSYEQLKNRSGFEIEINKESILEAYPDSNIK